MWHAGRDRDNIAEPRGDIELQINDGMWLPVSEAVMTAMGGYVTGAPMTEEAQQDVARALAKLLNGSSGRAAEVLVARIAIRHC